MNTFRFKANGKTPEGASFKMIGDVRAEDALSAATKASVVVREMVKCDADNITVNLKRGPKLRS